MRKGAPTANGYSVVGMNHRLEEGYNFERVYMVAFVEQVCFTPSVSDLKPAGQPYVPYQLCIIQAYLVLKTHEVKQKINPDKTELLCCGADYLHFVDFCN